MEYRSPLCQYEYSLLVKQASEKEVGYPQAAEGQRGRGISLWECPKKKIWVGSPGTQRSVPGTNSQGEGVFDELPGRKGKNRTNTIMQLASLEARNAVGGGVGIGRRVVKQLNQ